MSNKRRLNKVYSPSAYRTNTFNKYSPKARMRKLVIGISAVIVVIICIIAFFVVPNISFKKEQQEIIEVLPTPVPTMDPYKDLFMPDDIEFFDEIPSWVKTDYYGRPVGLLREPSENGETMMEIVDKENVLVVGETKDYNLVLYNKRYGFVKKELIFEGVIPRTPAVINEIIIEDVLSGVKKSTHLVNVEKEVAGVKVDLELFKEDNFLGKRFYPVHLCMIQSDTAKKLKKAQALFAIDGYTMVIWDAYRPYSTTVAIYEEYGHLSKLIAGSQLGSRNNRGASVDITLIKNDGTPFLTPTEGMTYDVDTAYRFQKGLDEEVKQNVKYMAKIMAQAGFDASWDEWWHFDDRNWAYYPTMDYDLFDF